MGTGQHLPNPTPQQNVMRALLRGLHRWVKEDKRPPASQYPRLADRTLVPVDAFRLPMFPRVRDPKMVPGPRRRDTGEPLPFLVPQVDEDGNETAGIRVPELAVPLATTTGWNFRAESVGNPSSLYALLGSYIPFARTRAEREMKGDPRRAIDERYTGRDDYLRRIDEATAALVKDGYLLQEDAANVRARAASHWDHLQRPVTATGQ
jgi:hypothetical protein